MVLWMVKVLLLKMKTNYFKQGDQIAPDDAEYLCCVVAELGGNEATGFIYELQLNSQLSIPNLSYKEVKDEEFWVCRVTTFLKVYWLVAMVSVKVMYYINLETV